MVTVVIAIVVGVALLALSISWGCAIHLPLAKIAGQDGSTGTALEVQPPTLRLVRAD
jgi:hypothetical protein